MKKKYFVNKTLILSLSVIVFLLFSCSNKYDALRNTDKAPVILTDKDSLNVRYKDYSNFNLGAGYLKINLQNNFFVGLNLTFIDSLNIFKVFYEGKLLTLPLAVNQYSIIFVSCEKIGQYPFIIKCVDAFGNASTKIIIVNSVDDVPPVANLSLFESTGTSVYTLDGSLSSSPKSSIVTYNFYIDNYLVTSKLSKVDYQFYSGTHTVSLIVVDDLGKASQQVQHSLIIQ